MGVGGGGGVLSIEFLQGHSAQRSNSLNPFTLYTAVPFLTEEIPLLYTFYRQMEPL